MDMGTTSGGQAKKISSNSAWDLYTRDLNDTEIPPDADKLHYHPNIAGVRRQHDAWMYVNKLEDPKDEVFFDEDRRTLLPKPSDAKGTSAASHSIWHTIVASPTKEDMLLNLKKLAPKEAMNNAPSHDYYIAREFKAKQQNMWHWPQKTKVVPWKRYDAIEQ